MINTTIRNQEGVDEFFAIWYKLGEFEQALSEEMLEEKK